MCRLFVVQPYGRTKMTTRATSSCLMRSCGWGTPSLIPSLTQNQLRTYGTLLQDIPFSRDPLVIEPPNNNITIPLSTLGTIIYADTCVPTQEELAALPHVVLIADSPLDPYHIQFPSRDMEAVKINATQTHKWGQLIDNH